MAKLTRLNKKENGSPEATEILAIMSGNEFTNPELGRDWLGTEDLGLNDLQLANLSQTSDRLYSLIKSSKFVSDLAAKGASEEQIHLGCECAVELILASGNPDEMRNRFNSQLHDHTAPSGSTMIDGSIVSDGDAWLVGAEAFDPYVEQDFVAIQAAATILAAVQGGFEETFFTPVSVSLGQGGYDFEVNIQRVFQRIVRKPGGAPTPFIMHKMIDAQIDPSILLRPHTPIIPYAVNDTEPPEMVTETEVPSQTLILGDIPVRTRPLKFFKNVSLITISNAPALLGAGTLLDHTDTLANVMNVGTLYFKVKMVVTPLSGAATTISAVVPFDVSRQRGALFVKRVEGRPESYIANMEEARLIFNPRTEIVSGDKVGLVAQIQTALGLPVDSDFTIVATARVNGSANTQFGDMSVDCSAESVVIKEVYNNVNASVAPELLNIAGRLVTTFEPVGYAPQALRSNSNVRLFGTFVDDTVVDRYRLALKPGQPFTIHKAIGAPQKTTVASISNVLNGYNLGLAVKELMGLEKLLDSNQGIPANCSLLGAEFVKPKLVRKKLDVLSYVVSLGSKDARANLQGQLSAAVTNMMLQLLIESHYLAAIKYVTQSETGFEVVIVTDPIIASYLWVSGDDRTVGDKNNYVITRSLHKDIAGKIYLGFRRTTRAQPHPIDLGVQLIGTPITQNIDRAIPGNAMVNELRVVPNTTFYATCPVLAVMEVQNLTQLFSEDDVPAP